MLSFIVIVCLTAITTIGVNVNGVFNNVANVIPASQQSTATGTSSQQPAAVGTSSQQPTAVGTSTQHIMAL